MHKPAEVGLLSNPSSCLGRTFWLRSVRGVPRPGGQGSYSGWAGALDAGRAFRGEPTSQMPEQDQGFETIAERVTKRPLATVALAAASGRADPGLLALAPYRAAVEEDWSMLPGGRSARQGWGVENAVGVEQQKSA
jgi:hypothetical protein